MTDFDAVQRPNQKSPFHGRKDADHGPHEHGMGGKKPDHGPAPFPVTGLGLAAATVYPSYFYVSSTPPVTDQGQTPECVAFSSAYDTNQQDRPELGRYNQMDHDAFFSAIGGTSDGAYMDKALAERRDVGYPEQVNVPASGSYPAQDGSADPGSHRIASFTELALTPDVLKAAFYGHRHGVLMIGPWFHSWFHPFASGKLPAPDYEVGGHAVWYRGWNDSYGIRARNSWGTGWGLAGDFYLPYAFIAKLWAAYSTTDAP